MAKTILVVEDSLTQAVILEHLLLQKGYHVQVADNGKKALDWLTENKADLVISDIMMPVVNGYTLCRQIKSMVALQGTPVILLTSLADPEEVIEGLSAGADSFITKPYEPAFLLSHVEKVLADKTSNALEKKPFGVEIYFEGKKRIVQAEQQQTIRLLLNIYEGAIQQQAKYMQTAEDLKDLNDRLETLVSERTADLSVEIEERKRVETELLLAKEKAELSDRLKSAFLANMSHEIRTPMNAIVGFANLMSEKGLSETEQETYAEIIKSRSDDLMHLINDLLEISRIESGNATVVKDRVSLNAILDEMNIIYGQRLIKIKKEAIILHVEKNLPDNHAEIITDGFILRQVFSNLIDNAIKYTLAGSISFGYHAPENGLLTLFVTDTGIGISEANQQIIFEHFRQSDIINQQYYGGTGLGLSICKGSLALLGGKIHVKSEPGKGSTFLFTIPYDVPVSAVPAAAPDRQGPSQGPATALPDWSQKKILLVEDEPTNMEFLTLILKNTGVQMVKASCGKEVRDNFPIISTFDLVLLDVRLPDDNGWDLATVIKNLCPSVPVIAQTAFAMQSDRRKSEEVGCDDYIAKPIKKQQLLQMLAKFLH